MVGSTILRDLSNMDQIYCRLCQNSNTDILYDIPDFWLREYSNKYKYYSCKNCGTKFLDPHVANLDFNVIYPETYEVYNQHKTNNKISKFLINFGLSQRYKVFSVYKNKGKILDIGCADAAFLKYLRRFPEWDLFGFDKKKLSIDEFDLHGINITFGELSQINFESNQFDIITMWDVLEHLDNPSEVISYISNILLDNGKLIIKVPNGDSLDSIIFGRYWAGIDPPRHIFIFNRKSISQLLISNNFQIKKINTQFGGYLNFIKSIQFFLSYKIKNHDEVVLNLIRFLKNPIFRFVGFPFFKLINIFGFGSSLVIIAEKN